MGKFNYDEAVGNDGVFPWGDGDTKSEEATAGTGTDHILESAATTAPDYADVELRNKAIRAVMGWAAEGGDYSLESLEEWVTGIADLDGDDELDEDEEQLYNDLWPCVSDALLSFGVSSENVDEFINNEDAKSGKKLGKIITGVLDNLKGNDDEIAEQFTVGSPGSIFESVGFTDDEAILEAAYKNVKVVKNGKVVIKKKRVSGRGSKRSPKQKAALKKARRRANSSAARMKRAKTNRLRKSKGL